MKAPEMMTYQEKMKTARKWAREHGGVLKRAPRYKHGRPVYDVVAKDGGCLMLDWPLLDICIDAYYE